MLDWKVIWWCIQDESRRREKQEQVNSIRDKSKKGGAKGLSRKMFLEITPPILGRAILLLLFASSTRFSNVRPRPFCRAYSCRLRTLDRSITTLFSLRKFRLIHSALTGLMENSWSIDQLHFKTNRLMTRQDAKRKEKKNKGKRSELRGTCLIDWTKKCALGQSQHTNWTVFDSSNNQNNFGEKRGLRDHCFVTIASESKRPLISILTTDQMVGNSCQQSIAQSVVLDVGPMVFFHHHYHHQSGRLSIEKTFFCKDILFDHHHTTQSSIFIRP